MKIVKLSAENFKKLRAVEITPAGELVEITGRNGAGKSSVLDAIWAALGGAKHIQAAPIRQGANTARIRLDLGELVVERLFTDPGAERGGPIKSTLTVEKVDGARFTSPQGILDALLGALTFDPLAFANEEPRKQFEMLRGIVPLEVDLEQLDGLNRRDFDKRTEINREAKSRRAQADGIVVPSNLPEAPADVNALLNRIAGAAKVNAAIETGKGQRAQGERDIADQRAKAITARGQASQARQRALNWDAEAEAADNLGDHLQKALEGAPPLPEAVDVDAIRAELATAEATNRGFEQRARKAELLNQAEMSEAAARELTEMMAAREQAKADAIAKAPMPVPGLGFGNGVVTFNGVPFDQASSAEQLRVSVAIAMAANPKLRVIRIQEGSLLDADNLALIAEMARERDYQVWIERVDTSGKVGVVIEDGQVIAVNGGGSQP